MNAMTIEEMKMQKAKTERNIQSELAAYTDITETSVSSLAMKTSWVNDFYGRRIAGQYKVQLTVEL